MMTQAAIETTTEHALEQLRLLRRRKLDELNRVTRLAEQAELDATRFRDLETTCGAELASLDKLIAEVTS